LAGATVDPRLLAPGARPSPAELVAADLGGAPALLRVEGSAASWAELDRLDPDDQAEIRRFLAHVTALTVGVGPAAAALAGAFDLWTGDPAEADRWAKGFDRAPRAAMAAALLVRSGEYANDADTWSGLVAESATYSLLQAGPDFRQWSEHHPPRGARDVGSRVRVDRHGRLWEVVLTRPHRHNALDTRMRDELHAALGEARSRPDVTVVLRGDGPSFCSGGDLDEFGTAPGPVDAHAVRLARSLALLMSELAPRIVVGLHGSCLGAGIELPAFAGRCVAAEDARVGLPELDLGLIPGAGGTVSIPRRAGSAVLLDLLLSGGSVDAPTALARGLVDEVVAPDRLLARLRDLVLGAT
jgi:enoyl-CoA hydratase/carnithine racemase